MVCKVCKREIENDSIYCRFCGERHVKSKKKNKIEVNVPKPKQRASGNWYAQIM